MKRAGIKRAGEKQESREVRTCQTISKEAGIKKDSLRVPYKISDPRALLPPEAISCEPPAWAVSPEAFGISGVPAWSGESSGEAGVVTGSIEGGGAAAVEEAGWGGRAGLDEGEWRAGKSNGFMTGKSPKNSGPYGATVAEDDEDDEVEEVVVVVSVVVEEDAPGMVVERLPG
ncbi:hypothetical protein BJ508DRAFT_371423 [Ascobolus immersus RN42]|uniref:Uncharacterized protein n=1 Tax=Ascobolus immersus RN42 TaxID=1160509 RepID=A0A3N4IP17_ASCIM|nr:hypothetical protein BJ508DRAFT_371423 [Ascobolus immersus RN42]